MILFTTVRTGNPDKQGAAVFLHEEDPHQRYVDGKLMWCWPDGKKLPVVRGGATDDDGEEEEEDKNKTTTFTQAEMNRIAAREKKDGRRTREEEILKELGIDSLDKAKELIESARTAESDRLSETEKARQAAEREKEQAAKDRAEAAREKQNARIERELLKAGIRTDSGSKDDPDKQLKQALKLLDIDPEDDADTIRTKVEDLKKDIPAWFTPAGKSEGSADGAGGTPPPAVPPGGDKPNGTTKGIVDSQLKRLYPDWKPASTGQ